MPGTKFDEYGEIMQGDEKARLDNYAIQLQNNPAAQGYIICYQPQQASAQRSCERAKAYLVNTRGIDPPSRVSLLTGFAAEIRNELWVMPPLP